MVLEKSIKDKAYNLIALSYDIDSGTQHVRLTNWTADIVDEFGDAFTSIPDMTLALAPITISMEEPSLVFDVPLSDGVVSDISDGRAFSKVKVLVHHVREVDGVRDSRTVFRGLVASTIRNPKGRSGRVEFSCANWKSQLKNYAMGLPTEPQCDHTFGVNGCTFPVASREENASVDKILSGARVQLSGLSSQSNALYWEDGFLRKDGVRIQILSWSGNVFNLRREAPPTWLGAQVIARPGCNKYYDTCIFWDNEKDFSGRGREMPAHNPLIDGAF